MSTSGSSPKRPVGQASKSKTPSRPPSSVIGDEQWRALLIADGTAPALSFQRDFVRVAVRKATGIKPSLQHLTIGQAERILSALNTDVSQLHKSGRNSPWITKVATICKWVALAIVVLFATFAVPGGFVIALGIIAGLIVSGVRRRARQEWEDHLLAT